MLVFVIGRMYTYEQKRPEEDIISPVARVTGGVGYIVSTGN